MQNGIWCIFSERSSFHLTLFVLPYSFILGTALLVFGMSLRDSPYMYVCILSSLLFFSSCHINDSILSINWIFHLKTYLGDCPLSVQLDMLYYNSCMAFYPVNVHSLFNQSLTDIKVVFSLLILQTALQEISLHILPCMSVSLGYILRNRIAGSKGAFNI